MKSARACPQQDSISKAEPLFHFCAMERKCSEDKPDDEGCRFSQTHLLIILSILIVFQSAVLVMHEKRLSSVEDDVRRSKGRNEPHEWTDLAGDLLESLKEAVKTAESHPVRSRQTRDVKGGSLQLNLLSSISKSVELLKSNIMACHKNSGDKTIICREGKRGKAGPRGEKGERGSQGQHGSKGQSGISGTKGEKGNRGAKGEPGLSMKKPEMIAKLSSTETREGSSATFTCTAKGNPKPTIEWTVSGTRVSKSTERFKLIGENALEISSLQASDSGEVKCVAKNFIGSAESIAMLGVISKPAMTVTPKQLTIEQGSNIHIKCKAEGHPKPTITWKRLLGDMPSSKKIMANGSLYLRNVHKDHSGIYECQGKNNIGESSATAVLFVQDTCGHIQYTVLKEEDRASSFYRGTTKCDNALKSGWYRFADPAGTQMLSTCPEDHVSKRRCGTYSGGWLDGGHPPKNTGVVTRRVCYAWSNSCCKFSNTIKVINCGHFYLYKLNKTPRCKLRYCGNS